MQPIQSDDIYSICMFYGLLWSPLPLNGSWHKSLLCFQLSHTAFLILPYPCDSTPTKCNFSSWFECGPADNMSLLWKSVLWTHPHLALVRGSPQWVQLNISWVRKFPSHQNRSPTIRWAFQCLVNVLFYLSCVIQMGNHEISLFFLKI